MEAKLMVATTTHGYSGSLKDLVNQQDGGKMLVVTASSDQFSDGRPPMEAMEAKLMVATTQDDCQSLKNLVKNQQDAEMMLVVMASSDQSSQGRRTSEEMMHPLLAEAASLGNWKDLNFLLNGHGVNPPAEYVTRPEFIDKLVAYSSRSSGDRANRSLAMQQPHGDVEEGIDEESVLKGVTMDGDTGLHLVVSNGEGQNFMNCADIIHGKDKALLCQPNYKGDTPLHCAARAGNSEMVSHLIGLARGDNIVEELLRQENTSKETLLHEAVRNGDHQMVKDLLATNRNLACFPEEGTSPLYLAILLQADSIAKILYEESENNVLSYLGPNGQNVLHAAVLRGPVITRKVLEWNKNKGLTTERDENGSTPLHFAAGLLGAHRRGSVCSQVFGANTAALYQQDDEGLSPIHVAASAGAYRTIAMFVNRCPSCAGLRDIKGRTFPHVAVEKKKLRVVRYACRNPSLTWILNMRDNDGNTALHIAVQAGSLLAFSVLFWNGQVNLNLTNGKGETPLDVAEYKNPENLIHKALRFASAIKGVSRQDHRQISYDDIHGVKSNYKTKELEKLKDTTQILCIGSVLIATVTFGATFALPGGYRGDDHPDAGTPTLAGRYAFDAFMMANTVAFIFSSIATVGFMYSGSPLLHLWSRQGWLHSSVYFMHASVTALTAAFALCAYLVLAPVAHKTAIGICVLSTFVPLASNVEKLGKQVLLAAVCARKGLLRTLVLLTRAIMADMVLLNWPLIFIFFWALYSTNQSIPKVEPPAQLPEQQLP